jgi:hypothetical protein
MAVAAALKAQAEQVLAAACACRRRHHLMRGGSVCSCCAHLLCADPFQAFIALLICQMTTMAWGLHRQTNVRLSGARHQKSVPWGFSLPGGHHSTSFRALQLYQ